MGRRLLLLIEGATWLFGVVGLVACGTYHLWAHAAARLDVERFVAPQDVAPQAGTPDQSLWSNGRIVAEGPKDQMLQPERLESLFGIRVDIARHDGYYHLW